MNAPIQQIPDGFVKNAAGHLVPEHQVREQDKLRDNVARDLAAQAVAISDSMTAFKAKALADIEDLISISLERYGVKLGGKKGNVSITTYDGEFKIELGTANIMLSKVKDTCLCKPLPKNSARH